MDLSELPEKRPVLHSANHTTLLLRPVRVARRRAAGQETPASEAQHAVAVFRERATCEHVETCEFLSAAACSW